MGTRSQSWPHPAYAIHTPRLTIRAYERGDVDAVHDGVIANADALRPWMPWVDEEPLTRDARVELLRRFRGVFDLGQDFIYGIFDRESGRFVGGCGLHPRQSAGALEIGYWIVQDRWGQGLATETASALTRVGFEVMEAERVEIRVEPDNARSLAVPRKLGFKEEGRLRAVGDGRGGRPHVDLMVFGLLPYELSASAASKVEISVERFG
jgi:RimJ/RimL family protein N-acetyltransferase